MVLDCLPCSDCASAGDIVDYSIWSFKVRGTYISTVTPNADYKCTSPEGFLKEIDVDDESIGSEELI